jgi:hypothetical protein
VTARQGASVERTVDAPIEAVATVLGDPRTYDGVVVGTRRIRWFDPSWPDVGARFHHTLGFGPVVVRDHSEVVEEHLPRYLRLLVHLRPVGSAEVEFRMSPEGGDRTHVTITETPVSGPLALAWSPPAAAVTRWRNARVLHRLGKVASGRARTMARGTGGDHDGDGSPDRAVVEPDAGSAPAG